MPVWENFYIDILGTPMLLTRTSNFKCWLQWLLDIRESWVTTGLDSTAGPGAPPHPQYMFP